MSNLAFTWRMLLGLAILALLCKVMPLSAKAHGQWGPVDCAEVIVAALGDDMDVIWSWPQTSARMVITCLVEDLRRVQGE